MGKIGDLFVRLGLKSEGFEAGIEKAKAKTASFGQSLTKMKGVAVAVWAAVGTVAVSAADNFAHQSQKFGDAWDVAMSRMKAAWDTFITSLNGWNWDNFFGRMKTASEAAASLAATKDRGFEVQNSIKLQKAAMQEELDILQIRARNQQLSYQERLDAANEYLAKVKPLYDAEAKYYEELATATENDWLAKAGLAQDAQNRAYLEEFLKRLEMDAEMMQALSDMAAGSKEAYAEYIKWAFSGEEWKRIAGTLYNAYQEMAGADQTAQALVDAIAGRDTARAAFFGENRRIFSSMNMASAQVSKGNDLENEAAAPAVEFGKAFDALLKEVESRQDRIRSFWAEELQGILSDTESFNTALQDELDATQNIINDSLTGNTIKSLDEIGAAVVSLAETLQRELITAFEDLAEAFASGEGINAGQIVKTLLTPFADMAVSLGTIVMLSGEAIESLKASLVGFFGGSAVVAGAALIGVGIAAKAGLAAIASSGGGATATTATSSSSIGTDNTSTSELVVRVEGTIKGSDIVISGQKTSAAWAR